jgi:hypothetical protein
MHQIKESMLYFSQLSLGIVYFKLKNCVNNLSRISVLRRELGLLFPNTVKNFIHLLPNAVQSSCTHQTRRK